MQDRFTIKIAGSAGQGIKSSGLIIAKALKRSGYFTFGYTEYPSLIRGGHNVYQIEVSDHSIGSVTKDTDVLLALNRESIDLHINEFDKDGGIIIIDTTTNINEDQAALIEKYGVKVYSLPMLDLATAAGGNAIMKNTVSLGAIWKTLGLEIDKLLEVVAEVFNKSPEIIEANKKAAQAGFEAITDKFENFKNQFKAQTEIKDQLIITGNEALSAGAIAAGVKIYSSYPMTPASSILTSLAAWAKQSGMLVKQAEDEITASNMCVGANFAGARALCGTSGGGLDLMSESISLAGITETPFVVVLAQRHGAATGAPTWTGQSDLNLALHTAHGEFPRIVVSCSDAEDAYYLIGDAFNLAEKFQLPVLILTEKYIAESTYTTPEYDQDKILVERGDIVNPSTLTGAELRYKITETGISPRWLPGDKGNSQESRVNSTFIANSDEHTEKGLSTEDANTIKAQVEKRMKKLEAVKELLPEPLFYGDENPDIVFITWGSNKKILEDAAHILRTQGKKIKIMHYTYLWPFKGEAIKSLENIKDRVFVVEQNQQGQLAELIKSETGINFTNRLLRYDSRPFYLEDIIGTLNN